MGDYSIFGLQFLINIAIVLVPLLLGLVFGRIAEARHYRSIKQREAQYLALPTTNNKQAFGPVAADAQLQLCTGSVVISVDYFKRIAAALRHFFGGRMQVYETLVDRARREAILRMKEHATGASQIYNLRIETSSISKGRRKGMICVEVLAYGTAVMDGDKRVA